MASGASNFVEGVDLTFKIIFGISAFFLVGITTVMLIFVIRYNRKRHPKATQIKDNTALEVTWLVIPIAIVLLIFYYGYVAYTPQQNVPKDAMNVKVYGKMWVWSFEYEGGKLYDTLVLPVGKPVKLELYSMDVIHGFYVPAFRIKQDVVPGKNNFLWFIPGQLGEFDILCSMYCGLRHSYMESKVRVVPEATFKAWLAALPAKSVEPEGLLIIQKNACTGCHSLSGSKLVGPSFKGLYGSSHAVITDGNERTITANDEYIRTSVYDPGKDIVKGYPKVMQTYKGKVSEDDMKKIIEYLKTLK